MTIYNNTTKYIWISGLSGIHLLSPVLTFFFLFRNLEYSHIFIIYAVLTFCMFIFEIPTGLIGDKYGRKTSILIAHILNLFITIGLIFAWDFIPFLILFGLMGIAITFESGSDEALIYDSLKSVKKEKEMKSVFAKIGMARMVPILILSPIASIIAKDLTNFQFIFLLILSSLFKIIAIIIITTLKEPEHFGKKEKPEIISLIKDTINTITNSPKLIKLFLNKTFILIPGTHIFMLLWQPYLKDSGISVIYFGTLAAISGILIYFVGKNIENISNKYNGKAILLATGIIPALLFMFAAFSNNWILALFFFFGIKILVWFRNPLFSEYINKYIESHNRATVLSSLSIIDSFFDVIIFLSASAITISGYKYAFLCSGIFMIIGLILFRIKSEDIN
jgi:MFS family permease